MRRTRCIGDVCTVTELNAISGFNVLPGDTLDVEVVIKNRGITTSVATDARLTLPDGTSTDSQLPALATYQAHKMYEIWEVPENTSIGTVELLWEADVSRLNTADADLQNNLGSIELFVGRLPTPVVAEPTGLTQDTILIDASESFDEDGGDVACEFWVPFDDGTRTWTTSAYLRRRACSITRGSTTGFTPSRSPLRTKSASNGVDSERRPLKTERQRWRCESADGSQGGIPHHALRLRQRHRFGESLAGCG